MKQGKTYRIGFQDPEQPEYTWYCGEGKYVGPDSEDYGTNEQHYKFILPDDDEVLSFPKSSISEGLDHG